MKRQTPYTLATANFPKLQNSHQAREPENDIALQTPELSPTDPKNKHDAIQVASLAPLKHRDSDIQPE